MDELHYSILEGFNVDRILTPEQRAATDLVNELALGSRTESMQVNDDAYILKFAVPEHFVGMKISEVDFRKDYSLRLIAISRPVTSKNLLGISHSELKPLAADDSNQFEHGDQIVCYGTRKALQALFRNLA